MQKARSYVIIYRSIFGNGHGNNILSHSNALAGKRRGRVEHHGGAFMLEVVKNIRLVWRLVQDPRVPAWIKFGIPLLVGLYFIWPLDLIPDFLVGPGEIDDLGVVLLGMSLIVRFSPGHIVDEHKRALGMSDEEIPYRRERQPETNNTIDGDYRVIPPE